MQWAAFGSEAIQSKITRGHRVTLTYISRTTYGMGATAGHPHVNPSNTSSLRSILLMALRRILYHVSDVSSRLCTSVYPHISMAAHDTIQHVLEGEDMIIYRILGRLATDIRVDMILDDKPVKGGNAGRRSGPSLLTPRRTRASCSTTAASSQTHRTCAPSPTASRQALTRPNLQIRTRLEASNG